MNDTDTSDIKSKLANPDHWLRLLIMLGFSFVLFIIARFVLSIVMLVQWILVLFTGETNQRLKEFTAGVNRYAYQIMEYMCFNSDERPFPFSDWPAE